MNPRIDGLKLWEMKLDFTSISRYRTQTLSDHPKLGCNSPIKIDFIILCMVENQYKEKLEKSQQHVV